MTTSDVYSLVNSGKTEVQVGAPSTHRFWRRPSLILKRLPERAMIVRLDDQLAAAVGIFRPQGDAVADAEVAGALEGDFLVVPVGVVGELDGFGRALVMIVSGPLPSRRIFDGR
ncbi:MAG: hypothetical protein U0992_12025 [Planctomycetaceae bacterium]